MGKILTLNVSKLNSFVTRFDTSRLDLSYPLNEIGEYLVSETLFRFDTETDPFGDKWERSVSAEKEGRKTLTKRGFLRQSITYNVIERALEVGVGNFPVYARIHQFGGYTGRNRSVNLPARPYLGVNDADNKEIDTILIEYAYQHYMKLIAQSTRS